ncbi:MAG: PEP-CTERM sorting domain-containing protein [Acidobacteriota bacterium]|nr:PEP-CTERM sorting domain-containing protein [Acidobacteriota bacterium]
MIGDPVTSTLHISSGGWDGSGAAIVGPGIEFSRTFGSFAHLTLDIAASSFTLTYIKDQPSNGFNAGLDGFEFTDLIQTFAGVSLVPGNTFPNGTFTSTSVSANNIHIFMNQPIIPDGATWMATWTVNSSSSATPEPGTFALLFLGLATLALPARFKRKQGRL